MAKSKITKTQERKMLDDIARVLREPLPNNGQPHIVVIVYDSTAWNVTKAAPKGVGRVDG